MLNSTGAGILRNRAGHYQAQGAHGVISTNMSKESEKPTLPEIGLIFHSGTGSLAPACNRRPSCPAVLLHHKPCSPTPHYNPVSYREEETVAVTKTDVELQHSQVSTIAVPILLKCILDSQINMFIYVYLIVTWSQNLGAC